MLRPVADPVSFKPKAPPVLAKAPRLVTALAAVVRSVAPVTVPSRVAAVMTPAAPCVSAEAFSVTVCPAAFNGPLRFRAAAVPVSSRLNAAEVFVNVPRLAILLAAVVRFVTPVTAPVRVPAVMMPAAVCVRVVALSVTV